MEYLESPTGKLIHHLLKGSGFTHPATAVAELSGAQAVSKPEGSPHSVADILAHMNYWQVFTLSAIAGEPKPVPSKAALGWPTVDETGWDALVEAFSAGLEQAIAYTEDAALLERPLSPGKDIGFGFDRNTVGSALTEIVACHNGHHTGQIILLRRMLNLWPPEGGGMTW